jgi:hypothetical protein
MKLADQHFSSVTTALQSREQPSAIPGSSRVAAHQKTALPESNLFLLGAMQNATFSTPALGVRSSPPAADMPWHALPLDLYPDRYPPPSLRVRSSSLHSRCRPTPARPAHCAPRTNADVLPLLSLQPRPLDLTQISPAGSLPWNGLICSLPKSQNEEHVFAN